MDNSGQNRQGKCNMILCWSSQIGMCEVTLIASAQSTSNHSCLCKVVVLSVGRGTRGLAQRTEENWNWMGPEEMGLRVSIWSRSVRVSCLFAPQSGLHQIVLLFSFYWQHSFSINSRLWLEALLTYHLEVSWGFGKRASEFCFSFTSSTQQTWSTQGCLAWKILASHPQLLSRKP